MKQEGDSAKNTTIYLPVSSGLCTSQAGNTSMMLEYASESEYTPKSSSVCISVVLDNCTKKSPERIRTYPNSNKTIDTKKRREVRKREKPSTFFALEAKIELPNATPATRRTAALHNMMALFPFEDDDDDDDDDDDVFLLLSLAIASIVRHQKRSSKKEFNKLIEKTQKRSRDGNKIQHDRCS